LSQPVRGGIEAILRRHRSGAFNGQEKRQELIAALLGDLKPDVIVETGTYSGDSAAFLSRFAPTHTIEADPRYIGYTRTRFLFNRRVHLHPGDSRAMLRELTPSFGSKRCFVYLDAHWDDDDLPLAEELRILSSWTDVTILIDDFAVPGDDGYRFDSYSAGSLTLEYLPGLPGFDIYFPAVRSQDETGGRRGCVLLTKRPPVPSTGWSPSPINA
jgi:hypothetical protein